MDERPPRNLKAMLSEAKDTSELMVDLAYAAVYFGDPQMAEEVEELEERLTALVHDMRAVCVMAARAPREADQMASVLQVVSSIEHIGNAAVDIARIVTRRLGIPRALVADLSQAEEISHRVRIRTEQTRRSRSAIGRAARTPWQRPAGAARPPGPTGPPGSRRLHPFPCRRRGRPPRPLRRRSGPRAPGRSC